MRSNLKKILILISMGLIFLSNPVMAKGIDKIEGPQYSRSQFTIEIIQDMQLKGYKSLLQDQMSDRTLMYKRYIDGKSTKADLDRIWEYSYGNKEIEKKAMNDMKYQYEQRDYLISFYSSLIQNFQNKVDVNNNKAKPFDFIKTKYGIRNYNRIVENQKTLDASFDKYIENERSAISAGKFSAIVDPSGKSRVLTTYEYYVGFVGWSKLENAKKKSKTNLSKATYEYYQYRLVLDERLYATN